MTAAIPTMDHALEVRARTPVATDHAADERDDADDAPLMDHSYDGIREYDNPLPSWWSIVFGASIEFAFLMR